VNQIVDDGGLDRLRQELRAEIHASAAETRCHTETVVAASAEETRRYAETIVEASAGETRRYIDGVETRIMQRMETFEVRILQHVETFEARIMQHVDAVAAETRRYFGVVVESLSSKIQIVAEGVIALDEKVERFRDEVHAEFRKVDRRFLHLAARVSARERPKRRR
jgi:hypothetical protein